MDDPPASEPTSDGATDDDTTANGRAGSARSALAWERVDATVAYSCPGFDVVRDEVRLPDGSEADYDYVTEPPAVVVLPFRADGRVVVIDEWRQAVDRVNRGLPAGTVESGETPVAAARRELREETGYRAGSLAPLLTVEPSNGIADSVHHHFLARDCEPAAGQDLERDESIEVETTTFAALRAAVRDDDLRDGRAALAVLAAAPLVDGDDASGGTESSPAGPT